MVKQAKGIKVEYTSLVIIWVALLSSQALFLLLIFFIRPQLFEAGASQQPVTGESPLIILAFAAAAIVFFGLSFVLRRQHLRRAAIDKDQGCVQTGLVLGCAMSEMCSILGVVLALAFDYQYFYAWIALGVIGILFHFPRKSSLDVAKDHTLGRSSGSVH